MASIEELIEDIESIDKSIYELKRARDTKFQVLKKLKLETMNIKEK